MKIASLLALLVFAGSTFAQSTFDVKDASKFFDIKIKVAKCEDTQFCSGPATFSFYKKGAEKPYQIISLPDTNIDLGDGGKASANLSIGYDFQSVVHVDDFNFDGMEDVAICNGTNGSYGMPSFNVYLSNRAAKKFILDRVFTKLAHHLGMFDVDSKRKTIETFDKSGCCWHITERYEVIGGRPRKVFEEIEDATIPDEKKVKITTKILVAGNWKTRTKYVKREE